MAAKRRPRQTKARAEAEPRFWKRVDGVNSEQTTDCTRLLKTKQRGNDAGS